MASKIKDKNESLDEKLLKLNKILKKEDLEMMDEIEFIGPEGDNRCAFVRHPYVGYSEFKENPNLKNKVQCPLYSEECGNYTRNNGIRPCVVLYITKKEK